MADVKWIKITTDIFDDEKILLIESMPDADALIVIWFKLLCLAGKQNNSGVFIMNDKLAYTDEMLATIFRRPVNTVRMALNAFENFGMIARIDGVITIPNWGKHQSLDAYEKKKEYDRERMRQIRKDQKALVKAEKFQESYDTSCDSSYDVVPQIRKEEEKKRKDKKIKEPTVWFPDDELLNETFNEFVEHRKKLKKPMNEYVCQQNVKKLMKLSGGDNNKAVAIIKQSIDECWQGLFELKENKKPKSSGTIDWENI